MPELSDEDKGSRAPHIELFALTVEDPQYFKGPSWAGPKKYFIIDAEDVSLLESLVDSQTTLIRRIENGDKLGAGAIAAHTQQVLAYTLHRVTGKQYECSKEAWEAMERSYWHGILEERGEL